MPAKAKNKITVDDDIMTTRQVAEKIGTDPRVLRRFLRANEKGVGPGARYAIKPADVADLKKRFTSWAKANEEAKAPKE